MKREKEKKRKQIKDVIAKAFPYQGRRSIGVEYLAKNLICGYYWTDISLKNIQDETIRGLQSVFSIKCHKCLQATTVETGKKIFNVEP